MSDVTGHTGVSAMAPPATPWLPDSILVTAASRFQRLLQGLYKDLTKKQTFTGTSYDNGIVQRFLTLGLQPTIGGDSHLEGLLKIFFHEGRMITLVLKGLSCNTFRCLSLPPANVDRYVCHDHVLWFIWQGFAIGAFHFVIMQKQY